MSKMKNAILLVVDMQKALVQARPYQCEKVIENIARLISTCRRKNIEVVYVRHDGGKGDELESGCDGWQIVQELAPQDGELVIDKRYNSAFRQTGLKAYLDEKEISTLILVGMQTEYCMDTTCKVGFEYGYSLIIPEETNTTFDNAHMTGENLYTYYTHRIWDVRFAKVVTMNQLEDML